MSAIQGEGGQDFDLNLAPIIDCFTVLITYLLVSASFISLTALDVGVAAAGQADPNSAAPKTIPYNLMIELNAQHQAIFKVTGGPRNVNLSFPVKPVGVAWDLNGVERQAESLVRKFPDLKEATLQTDPSIIYRDVVKIVETLKKALGKVFLAG